MRKAVLSWDSGSGIAFISGKKALRRRGTPKMKELVMRDSESLSSRKILGAGKIPLIRLSIRRLDAGSAEKGRIAALYTSATKGP